MPLLLLAALLQDAASLEGMWVGTLDVGAQKIRLLLRVVVKEGKTTATMDSVDQGAGGFAVDEITLEKGVLKFTMKAMASSFEGTKVEGRDAYEGNWSQGGMKLPITFEKTEKEPELRRPQTPKGPFPYESEEVTVKSGDLTLAGTLTRPKREGRFPAVLLVTGSGAQDRDEKMMGHKPFLVLADRLTRDGFAVLRMDDRGVGGSGGSTAEATLEETTADALACIAMLRERADIDPKRVGIAGHSEGGWVAPLAATKSKDVAFIVLLAGPAASGEAILKAQLVAILKAGGATAKQIEVETARQATTLELARTVADPVELEKRLKEAFEPSIQELPEAQREAGRKTLDAQIAMVKSRWFRHLLTFDPRATLEKVRCPTLVITGEKDLQVPPAQNHPIFADAFEKGGLKDYSIVKLPGLNHLFQTCRTGHPAEYGAIEETFAPAALDAVSAWLARRAK
jgi:hypothetical protein